MGFLSHRVGKDEIEAGDHIYTWRGVYAYSHHGIYIGENRVVHLTQEPIPSFASGIFAASSSKIALSSFYVAASCSKMLPACPIMPDSSSKIEVSTPKSSASCSQNLPACLECGFRKSESGVMLSCLDCFLAGGSLYRFEYGISSPVFLAKRGGTCTTAKSDKPEDVISRTMYLLDNGFGKYDFLENNCEDFALYCKTSLLIQGARGRSGQVSSMIDAPWDAVIRSSPLQLFRSSPIVIATAAIGNYGWSRYASDIGIRSDVVKVEVEDLASFRCSKGPKKPTKGDVQCRKQFVNVDLRKQLLNVDFSAFTANVDFRKMFMNVDFPAFAVNVDFQKRLLNFGFPGSKRQMS